MKGTNINSKMDKRLQPSSCVARISIFRYEDVFAESIQRKTIKTGLRSSGDVIPFTKQGASNESPGILQRPFQSSR